MLRTFSITLSHKGDGALPDFVSAFPGHAKPTMLENVDLERLDTCGKFVAELDVMKVFTDQEQHRTLHPLQLCRDVKTGKCIQGLPAVSADLELRHVDSIHPGLGGVHGCMGRILLQHE